ncbi:MAG: alpha/beta fold hydrolase [Planctomycetes bacterium]|nr:alpha/beta fold hydrolase [Planctomycetota bacterium]
MIGNPDWLKPKKSYFFIKELFLIIISVTIITTDLSAQEPYSGQLFEGNEVTLYYEVLGNASGIPLFVLNGGPGVNHNYLHPSKVWDELAKKNSVIFYDQRGTGKSPALETNQTCTLEDQINDLNALRRHLDYEKIILIGHSWGGYLSMAYAVSFPERVEKMILVCSAAPKWDDNIFLFDYVFPETVERRKQLALAAELGDADAEEAGNLAYLSMLFLSEEKRDEYISKCKDFKHNRTINISLNQDLLRYDLNTELAKLKTPVLVITARYDTNVAPLVSYKIHQKIDGSKFIIFERSGHMPFYEEPSEFLRIVENFLQEE